MVPVQTAAVHLFLTSCNVKVSQKALFPRKFPAELKALAWFAKRFKNTIHNLNEKNVFRNHPR